VPDLIGYGGIQRPTLGIALASDGVSRRLRIDGVLILNVYQGSGAEEAGLRPTVRNRYGRIELGDVIVAVDGQRVRSQGQLRLRLEQRQVGDTVEVTVNRDGREQTFRVRLGEPN
jgi:S1-C subfamily serine protease